MPSYQYLPSDEFEALIAFLQYLNKDAAQPEPETISAEQIPETPMDLAGYRAGRAVYQMYCVGCHGEWGNGGGRVGHVLSPEPRDFTDVIWMSKQTDVYLYSVITNGKSNTAMPAFKDILTPRESALALRYVRYFANLVTRERMELGFVLE
jgi:mono/diheme cytochrome c family protein